MIEVIVGVVMMLAGAALLWRSFFNWYWHKTQGESLKTYAEFWERRGWLKADDYLREQRLIHRTILPAMLLLVGIAFIIGGVQSL